MLDEICPCLAHIKQFVVDLFSDADAKTRHIALSGEEQVMRDRNIMSEDLFSHSKVGNLSLDEPQQQNSQRSFSSDYKPKEQTDLLQLDHNNDFQNLGEISLNIPQYGANYHLLKEKVRSVAHLLENIKDCTQIKFRSGDKNPSQLQRAKNTKLKIWKKPDGSFICQYQLPCTYETYKKLSQKQITADSKHKLIKEYKKLQIFQPNLDLRYLCTQKIGMLQSRYFTYLKYSQTSKTDKKGNWQICLSKQVNKQGSKPQSSANARHGRVYSVSYIKQEQNSEDGTKSIRIRTYISLDIHVVVENIWEKLLLQFKAYVEELWSTIQQNNQQFV